MQEDDTFGHCGVVRLRRGGRLAKWRTELERDSPNTATTIPLTTTTKPATPLLLFAVRNIPSQGLPNCLLGYQISSYVRWWDSESV